MIKVREQAEFDAMGLGMTLGVLRWRWRVQVSRFGQCAAEGAHHFGEAGFHFVDPGLEGVGVAAVDEGALQSRGTVAEGGHAQSGAGALQ